MRLNDNNTFIGINPPYQLSVIHSSKLIYPREIYQRGVERKRVELIARDFNEYIVNEPKVSFRPLWWSWLLLPDSMQRPCPRQRA